MPRFITAEQYKKLMDIPRGRLSTRTQIFCGAIVENKGKIVLVSDLKTKYPGYDIPGGKLLWGEEILECTSREFQEESRYKVEITDLLGIYQRKTGPDDEDYFRFIYVGKLKSTRKYRTGDPGIADCSWFDVDDILNNQVTLRSSEVLREIKDYKEGRRFPLDVVTTYIW